jgi:hypothetical protein
MRHPSGKSGVSCSFCENVVLRDGTEIMGFRLHLACADNVAAVLGKVEAFNQWKKAHAQALELTA